MPSTLAAAATTRYQSPGLLTAEPAQDAIDTLQVPALLFYEGKHISMDGTTNNFTVKKLEAIVKATNSFLAGGRRVKLYASDDDHLKISQGATIGFLVGELRLEEITAEKLPMPGLTDLIGKQGIYGTIQISGQENVQQYQDGRLKELSVAIDSGGVLFNIKDLIYEVSAVGLPSLAGAALFSVGNPPTPQQAIAHVRASLAYALTLADQLQEDAIQKAEMQLWSLFDAFMETLWDIRQAADDPEQLNGQTPEQLRLNAIEDFITQLRNRLQVTAPTPQPLPTIPLFGKTPMPPEETPSDIQRMTARIETLEAADKAKDRQLGLFARRETLSDRFATLRQQAIALRSAGKLSPASFDDKFKDKTVPAVAHFAVNQLDDAEKQIASFEQECDRLEYLLKDLEKHGSAIKFGMPVDGGGDLNNQEQKTEEVDAEANRLVETSSRFGAIY